ncbi:hypothetical protein JCM6882_002779 [Rhodosporidiobolus microsporus]
MNFSTFASNLLTSTAPLHQPPLVQSTTDSFPHLSSSATEDDILGASDDGQLPRYARSDRRFSFGSADDGAPSSPSPSPSRLSRTTHARSVLGPAASSLAGIPAFVSRLGGRDGTRRSGQGHGQVGRGWKAYESVVAPPAHRGRDAYSDEDSETDEDDGPLPGAFVSHPQAQGEPPGETTMDAPLLGRRTLFVYPVPGLSGGGGTNSRERYRDAGWIAAYGLSLLAVAVLAILAWWSAPPSPSLPSASSSASVLTTVPTLSIFALVSAIAGAATLAYILTIQHSLPTLMTLSIFGGPLLFVGVGVVAFAGSFAMQGVASDGGWKSGLRCFATVCFAAAFVLGRTAMSRRKELNRAISVGELACQTIISNPPLVVLALTLALTSTILTLPLVSLITTLLSLSPTSPLLASWGAAFALLVYLWTLAIGRGVSHAVVGGCVGTWYFEREGEGYQGPLEVTKASLARATGPSLGTVIAASFFLALFSTLSAVLSAVARLLRSSRLPNLLKPFTALAPLFGALAAGTAIFNSYSLSYAGMTGEGWWCSSKEVAELLRVNRARNIRDTALLRLTLFVASTGWGLLAGLFAFLLTSARLSSTSGGYAPMLAVLSYTIPLYTVKMCHNVIGDAVDALFVCAHLDAENQLSHCPKAIEAFGQPEVESLSAFV